VPDLRLALLAASRRPSSKESFVTLSRRRAFYPAVLAAALAAVASCPSVAPAAVTSASCGAVQYGGAGTPNAVIASDLPMIGTSRERSRQMVAGIKLALTQRGWKAGAKRVGYQVCDDAIASTGAWDPARCKTNAAAYAAAPDLLGVVGTYNSGCAALIIPVLNRAAVAMVSPGNTLVCLTLSAPGCPAGQPGKPYPTGKRNYARVVPNDAYQGAGLASFAIQQGVKRPFVLYAAKDPTSLGQARPFRGTARALGHSVARSPPGTRARALPRRCSASRSATTSSAPSASPPAGIRQRVRSRSIARARSCVRWPTSCPASGLCEPR